MLKYFWLQMYNKFTKRQKGLLIICFNFVTILYQSISFGQNINCTGIHNKTIYCLKC